MCASPIFSGARSYGKAVRGTTAEKRRAAMKALIVYFSKTGHTGQAANDIARGLEAEGVECDVRMAPQALAADLRDYEIVIVGTPTYGHRRYKRPAAPVSEFIESLKSGDLEGKTTGAFTAFAGYGGERLVAALEGCLLGLGGKVVAPGPAVKAGAPLSLYKGPDASKDDVEKCEDFGKRVAAAAK